MIPPSDDERPLGRTFREVEKKVPENQSPWFMRAKREYAEQESRRTIVEEKTMQPDITEPRAGGYAAAPPFQMDHDPRTGDLVGAKLQEIDQELTAIRTIFAQLVGLDGGARKRVFLYVSEKLGDLP